MDESERHEASTNNNKPRTHQISKPSHILSSLIYILYKAFCMKDLHQLRLLHILGTNRNCQITSTILQNYVSRISMYNLREILATVSLLTAFLPPFIAFISKIVGDVM